MTTGSLSLVLVLFPAAMLAFGVGPWGDHCPAVFPNEVDANSDGLICVPEMQNFFAHMKVVLGQMRQNASGGNVTVGLFNTVFLAQFVPSQQHLVNTAGFQYQNESFSSDILPSPPVRAYGSCFRLFGEEEVLTETMIDAELAFRIKWSFRDGTTCFPVVTTDMCFMATSHYQSAFADEGDDLASFEAWRDDAAHMMMDAEEQGGWGALPPHALDMNGDGQICEDDIHQARRVALQLHSILPKDGNGRVSKEAWIDATTPTNASQFERIVARAQYHGVKMFESEHDGVGVDDIEDELGPVGELICNLTPMIDGQRRCLYVTQYWAGIIVNPIPGG